MSSKYQEMWFALPKVVYAGIHDQLSGEVKQHKLKRAGYVCACPMKGFSSIGRLHKLLCRQHLICLGSESVTLQYVVVTLTLH